MSRLCLPNSILAPGRAILASGVAILVSALTLAAAPAVAGARVPQGFVGSVADGPLFNGRVDLGRQLDSMVASGVESLRVSFSWADAQPYAAWHDVPLDRASEFTNVGGMPTSFASTDQIVGEAARRGLTLLPVVLYTPNWDAAPHPPGSLATPRSNAPYANFLAALVGRYGPNGTYWRVNPQIPPVPIRMWQIWNEPDLQAYWPIQPFCTPPQGSLQPCTSPARGAFSYIALLRAAHAAIKRADPGAKVVLAGMPDYVWEYLAVIYKIPGARRQFDVVASHPYTSKAAGVITILGLLRHAMNRGGDSGKPILATEVSWPSSLGKTAEYFGFETTEAGQASKLAALLPMLRADRRALNLLGFYVYTWIGQESPGALSFQFAGLFRFSASTGRIFAKPAYGVFRHAALAMEACRVKASVATRCAKRG